MTHFIIESFHSEEECLEAHDQVAAIGNEVLEQYYWSCPDQHGGWALIEARDEEDAEGSIPIQFRNSARVIRVEKITREKLRAAHSNL